jgi:hypothetical protein
LHIPKKITNFAPDFRNKQPKSQQNETISYFSAGSNICSSIDNELDGSQD